MMVSKTQAERGKRNMKNNSLGKGRCYLKEGISIYSNYYKGQCGKRRGRVFDCVTISKENVTCPDCLKILNQTDREEE